MSHERTDQPPPAYTEFTRRFPEIAVAWDALRAAEGGGPLDGATRRLVKLAVAVASRSPGATHSAARKALKAGASPDALYQVVALAASTTGLPAAVAAFTWVRDVVDAENGDA